MRRSYLDHISADARYPEIFQLTGKFRENALSQKGRQTTLYRPVFTKALRSK